VGLWRIALEDGSTAAKAFLDQALASQCKSSTSGISRSILGPGKIRRFEYLEEGILAGGGIKKKRNT
jgi:hypothetical protein